MTKLTGKTASQRSVNCNKNPAPHGLQCLYVIGSNCWACWSPVNCLGNPYIKYMSNSGVYYLFYLQTAHSRSSRSDILQTSYFWILSKHREGEGVAWPHSCGKIPVTLWSPKTSCAMVLSEIQLQPILFVDSSEIRLWNSPERCQMNHSYSPVIFTKSSKMMFLCCSKN